MDINEHVTGDDVKAAMISAEITEVTHHGCAICGAFTRYLRHDEQLFYDSSCDCRSSDPQPRDWGNAARWIALQTDPEVKLRILKAFGFEVEQPVAARSKVALDRSVSGEASSQSRRE